MKNIIFMDIDGTLCDKDGIVPASAKQAIVETRQKGNEVYLCTGRSLPEITEDIQSVGFDGIIGAGGGYIEHQGQALFHKVMEENYVQMAIDYFKKHDLGYYLESNQGIYSSLNCIPKIQEAVKDVQKKHPNHFHEENPEPTWFYNVLDMNSSKDIDYDQINKVCFIDAYYPFEKTNAFFEPTFRVHHATVFEFGDNSGELGIKDLSKYTAIHTLLDKLDYDKVKTYAFGDGLNDIDMFEAVDFSVAMENGKDGLKKIANDITDAAEQDGIYKSFKKLGLI